MIAEPKKADEFLKPNILNCLPIYICAILTLIYMCNFISFMLNTIYEFASSGKLYVLCNNNVIMWLIEKN